MRGLGAWRPVVAWPRQGGHGDEVARRGGDGGRGGCSFLTVVLSGGSRSFSFTCRE